MGVEVVAIILSSSVAAVALARSLAAWLTARRSNVTVHIRRGHGIRGFKIDTVRIDLDNPEQAERFLREYLSRGQ